uniref:Uncharacterized protein n=1 Tax=Rhizophora mucronata TaxID=61149 RepID=A0A2P2PE86_RHIMU
MALPVDSFAFLVFFRFSHGSTLKLHVCVFT